MRLDLLAIERWIAPRSRVLDLGCGDGVLLQRLRHSCAVRGLGVEIDAENITRCVAAGLSVIEQDIDQGLGNFSDQSFDTVLLTQTLQAVRRPDYVLQEMLRVGKECIITFPNFGHWRARLSLLFQGKMPVSKFMPYHWYDTPNIHFCTVDDFEALCRAQGIRILRRHFEADVEGGASWLSPLGKLWPNLFASQAVYHVTRA